VPFTNIILLSLCSIIIVSCGFSPLYGQKPTTNNASVKSNLSQIEIGIIPNREGQFLRNELIDRFYINGHPNTPLYTLKATPISEGVANIDLTINSEATRRQLRLSTTMNLLDQKTGAKLLTRNLSAVTSYNVLESEYSTIVTEQSAREAALNDLARQIEQQIVLYLNR